MGKDFLPSGLPPTGGIPVASIDKDKEEGSKVQKKTDPSSQVVEKKLSFWGELSAKFGKNNASYEKVKAHCKSAGAALKSVSHEIKSAAVKYLKPQDKAIDSAKFAVFHSNVGEEFEKLKNDLSSGSLNAQQFKEACDDIMVGARASLGKNVTIDQVHDKDGKTILHYLAEAKDGDKLYGDLSKMPSFRNDFDRLLSQNSVSDNSGKMAVDYAKSANNKQMSRDLSPSAEQLARVDATLAMKEKVSIGFVDEKGRTPLHHAAVLGDSAKVRDFIIRGEKVDAQDNEGRTPLHYAAMSGDTDTFSRIEKELKGGSIAEVRDNNGRNYVYYAALSSSKSRRIELNERLEDCDSKDSTGKTAAHHLAQDGNVEGLLRLAKAGADLSLKDDSGKTPLEIVDSEGNLPIYNAAIKGDGDAFRFFYDKMPKPLNIPDDQKKTIESYLIQLGIQKKRVAEKLK